MFTQFKRWYHKKCLEKWLEQSYVPLFMFRRDIEKNVAEVLATTYWLEDTIKKLENPAGKDDNTLMRERWQALQFRKTLEAYHLALIKTNELLNNLPEIEIPKSYDIVFYDNDDDEGK